MKTCSKCKEKKELSDFNIDKSKLDGLRPDCKICRKEVSKKYIRPLEKKPPKPKSLMLLAYEEKELKRKQKAIQYRIDNKEKLKQYRDSKKEEKRLYDKRYKIINKEVINQKDKIYKEANKERLKQYRDSRKELKREYDKQYKIDNKERINERDRLYQQRKRLE